MGQIIFGIIMLAAAVLLFRLSIRVRRNAYKTYHYQIENQIGQPQRPRTAGIFWFVGAVMILLIAVLTLWDYWVYWLL